MKPNKYPHPETGELVSRQRLYQLRHQAAGLCLNCPQPVCPESKLYCQAHYVYDVIRKRERIHRRGIATRRNLRAKSYSTPESKTFLQTGA
jgi:hypothetical protein